MFKVIEKQKNKKRLQKNVDPTSYNIARKCIQHFQPMLHDVGPKCWTCLPWRLQTWFWYNNLVYKNFKVQILP